MKARSTQPISSASFVGMVDRITFRNAENGFTVMRVKPTTPVPESSLDDDGMIAVVGTMIEFTPGESVEFEGEWVTDARYGDQFKVHKVALKSGGGSVDGLVTFLSSGLVKGIGPKTAERIVAHFGKNTARILTEEPERLHAVIKKPALVTQLAEAWRSNIKKRDIMIQLFNYGITSGLAERIYEQYDERAVTVVEDDPYILADEVYGIGFIRADQIARAAGMSSADPRRLRAGLYYALRQMSSDGHVFAPRAELTATVNRLLMVEEGGILRELLDEEIKRNQLIADTRVYPGDLAVYLPEYFDAEIYIVERLSLLLENESPVQRSAHTAIAKNKTTSLIPKGSVDLSPQQHTAIQSALLNKVAIMTGGPGTGKTTALRALIEVLEQMEVKYALASPTGRAAKRLSEATGRAAFTIHRLLGFGDWGGFLHDETNPLEIDMLIIDEASMVDLKLFSDVVSALHPGAHLFVVGDVDQLPSVGAGNVLRDLIDSGMFPVSRLKSIFRQAEDSSIVVNAHLINQGEAPHLNQSKDFYFFDEQEPQAAAALLVDIVKHRIPGKFGYDPLVDVQVIAPMYRGEIGVTALNHALQASLNPNPPVSVSFGERTFRLGDKVMQTRNNYELNVYNGDIGYIREIDPNEKKLTIQFDAQMVDYSEKQLFELILAYCISTHRSQGSEYPVVVMPVMTQHYMMLQRNLLYTAITRAKSMVVLVGSRKAVHMAVQNDRVAQRYSGLQARLSGVS